MGLLLVLRFTGDDFHGWGGNKNGEVFPELRKIVPSFGGYKTGNDDEEVSDIIHFGASLLTLDKQAPRSVACSATLYDSTMDK
jgi:hypothetical protein